MSEMTFDALKHRAIWNELKSARAPVEYVWDLIEKFIAPHTGGRMAQGADEPSTVEWRRLNVWDSTAIDDAERLAANFHGTVTPKAVHWLGLAARDKGRMKDVDVATATATVADKVWEAFQDCDFYSETSASDLEFVVYGNSFLVEEEAAKEGPWAGLDFTAPPLRECDFVENYRGQIGTFYRRLSWTSRKIVERAKEGPLATQRAVPENIATEAKTPTGATAEHEVIFVVYERDAKIKTYNAAGEPILLPPDKRPWGSAYFLAETGEQLFEDGGYYRMPVTLARWAKTAGSKWGHGRGHTALPLVMWLNGLLELSSQAFEKLVDPAFMTTERGLMGDLDQRPGGLSVVMSMEDLRPLVDGAALGRADFTEKKIALAQAAIHRIFHIDDLQLKDSPAMTATEAQIRYELMTRVLGATLSRKQSDQLDPVIMVAIDLLYRAGQLPELPKEFFESGKFDIVYRGPMARAQRTDEVASIERLASFVAAMVKEGFPEAAEVFDVVSAVRHAADLLGVPPDVLVSKAKQEARTNARLKMQQEAAKAEVARAQGEAAMQAGQAAQVMGGGDGGSMPAQPEPILTPTFPG